MTERIDVECVYVLIETEPGKLDDVLREMGRMQEVVERSAVTGRYDIIAKVSSPDLPSALKVVVREIRRLPGIKNTETLVCMSVPKER